VKVTREMVEAARRILEADVSDDAICAALEAALAVAPAGKGARPSPAIASRIVTSRKPAAKQIAHTVVWSRKPKPRR
jgi:hypothetical protein